jgi:hypothetical protein
MNWRRKSIMVIKSNSIKGTVYFVLLGLLPSVGAAGAADTFYFGGYPYNETSSFAIVATKASEALCGIPAR